MSFLLIVVVSLAVLGVVAAVLSGGDNEPVVPDGDGENCEACSSRADCKLAELKNDIKRRGERKETCSSHLSAAPILLLAFILLTACSTKKNTSQSRLWQSFTARYNTYYNGSQAFIDGSIEKENGNKDNYTELIPLYAVGNKQSRSLGSGNFDRAIEKSEKAIKQHSIKVRPEWNKSRRKTQKDIEWLSRREYNPFLWRAWLLLGKSQFQKGEFEEAAATFSYMSRLYQSQPAIMGIARAWQAKSYVELDWLYDAEDIIVKQQRDTMHFRARKDWDYTLADYYLRSGRYRDAIPYLRKVISHEKRRKQKAREWFLLGQVYAREGYRAEAYVAFKRVVRLSPPYELEFNARIAQTEVMAAGDWKRMVGRLRRMASSDNNKDYLDQVYYAIGNIYMAQRDTLKAIEAYEEGNKKATRTGIEKGVLLLTLGNIYWEREKYADAQRCYGEAIGLLDKDRPDFPELDFRSKVLDELAPHTSAVELQDSLQRLAKMPEEERNKVIDKVIEDLIKQEEEAKRAEEEAEAEKVLAQQASVGNRQQAGRPRTPVANTTKPGDATWYFYNPQAVSQGKQTFQQQWGQRENADNWQRINKTVVAFPTQDSEESDSAAVDGQAPDDAGGSSGGDADKTGQAADSLTANGMPADTLATDSAAQDPHKREYYLAQIPFSEEKLAESDNLIKDGLFHAGIIFKDKLDNLALSERTLHRLVSQYADYEQNDVALYHLFLLYSRQGRQELADSTLARLQADYPESQWTILLSDPDFAENQRFGVHIEDSLYAATYDAFKGSRHEEVKANALMTEKRFPQGQHRAKFLFIEGLTLLNDGQAEKCMERLQTVVEKYPENEVTELAGMILRGVQQGRTLHGGTFDIDDMWTRRTLSTAADSTQRDTLSFERNANHVFLLAWQADSLDQNQLLFEMARYNFTNYLVRNFDLQVDQDEGGLCRMLVSGFLSYDEARQYARQLYGQPGMLAELLRHCRSIIVSEKNLALLGTAYSYRDYEIFFDQRIAPIQISEQPLLDQPAAIIQEGEETGDESPAPEDAGTPQTDGNDFDDLGLPPPTPEVQQQTDNDLGLPPPAPQAQQQPQQQDPDLPDLPPAPQQQPQQQNDLPEFDEDFWR